MLVGNKFDMKEPGKGVSKEAVKGYLEKHPRWRYKECSAKLNWNVSDVFDQVGGMVRNADREK